MLGIAAVVSAFGGLMLNWWSVKKLRREEEDACHERLKGAREEAELLSQQLHELRMETHEYEGH